MACLIKGQNSFKPLCHFNTDIQAKSDSILKFSKYQGILFQKLKKKNWKFKKIDIKKGA